MFSVLVAAAGAFVFFVNGHAFSSEQSVVVPVEIENAVVQAILEGCVPNVLGDLSVTAENASQMASVGLAPVDEEEGFSSLPVVPFEDLHKRGVVITSFAIRPSTTGRVIMGATPRTSYCGIVVFDASAVQAREKLLKAIVEKGWKRKRGGSIGDIDTYSAVINRKDIFIAVTGLDRAAANDSSYRLFASVAQVKD